MIYSITLSRLKNAVLKILKAVLVTAFWILVWEAVASFVSRDNELMLLLLPKPKTVFKTWLDIAFTEPYLAAVGRTLLRILTGFVIGLISGAVLGVMTYSLKIADWVLSPILKIIRAVPVVAITILFFSLFEADSLPVTIVALMVTPLVWSTVHDGLKTPQKALTEMAQVFRLSRTKTFLYVRLPKVLPPFLTASVNALGLAWKSGVAAEVISEPDVALGTMLMQGKGTVDFSTVYAITLTVVILSLIIEVLLKAIVGRLMSKKGGVSV